MHSFEVLGALEQSPKRPSLPLPPRLQLWHVWPSRKEDPPPSSFPLPLVPASSREPEKQWGDRGSRREGLGEWVGSHWGILSDSRERHLRNQQSGALPQGGHPQHPGGPEGSHGCGVGATCCVCFHSAEAAAATPLVVASRPRYIMSSAPPRSPRQRVFPSLLPSVTPARLAFGAQPRTRRPGRGGTGAGLLLPIDGKRRGRGFEFRGSSLGSHVQESHVEWGREAG